jgi:hypothetical protein
MDAADGTISEIAVTAAELGLNSDPGDIDALRSEIKPEDQGPTQTISPTILLRPHDTSRISHNGQRTG